MKNDMPRHRQAGPNPLDARLIEELEHNPRQTQAGLASMLSVSCPTIRARLGRLRSEDDLQIVCIVDPMVLGYTTTVIIGINAQPSELLNVGKKVAALKAVYHLALNMGRFDLIAWALFPDRRDYVDFLTNGIGNIAGITQVETMLVLRQVKFIGPLLSDRSYPRLVRDRTIPPGSLNSALISELQKDATQDTRGLARKLGTSYPTVARRIRSLEADGVIRIVAVANPLSLGYQTLASIGMKVEASKINEAAEALAFYRDVQTVSICAGQYEIMISTMFRCLDDLANFTTLELGKIPGLQGFDTMTNLRIIKASNQYLSPDT